MSLICAQREVAARPDISSDNSTRQRNCQPRAGDHITDERAGKVTQLLRHPRATLVMWSPALGWQLRCRVLLSLEMSGLAATSRWAKIKLTPAAQDYLARLPPGAPLDAAVAVAPEPLKREYFAVVSAQVLSIDWLELHRSGHRRARFDGSGSQWLQP